MENFLFEAAMPYCVEFVGKKIRVLNRHYVLLFSGIVQGKDMSKVYDFADYCDENFTEEFGGRVYLYVDSPIGQGETLLQYDELVVYYLRLTHLMEFCAGIQTTDGTPLLKR